MGDDHDVRNRGDPSATARQIDLLVQGVRDVLGQDLLGTYLHGSSVLGGVRPDSDIDVIVVSKRPTTAAERRRLIELLLTISGNRAPQLGRSIEFDIVVASEVRPWRYPPRFDFHYDELLRDRFESGELEPWMTNTNRDLASAITMVLLGDEPLTGPPPAHVFDPVPRDDYIDAILRDTSMVDEYLPWDTRNVVLTLSRIWSAVETDAVFSKEDAASWAVPRLPEEHRGVLERALDGYRGEAQDSWEDDLARARAYAEYVLTQIERVRGRSSST